MFLNFIKYSKHTNTTLEIFVGQVLVMGITGKCILSKPKVTQAQHLFSSLKNKGTTSTTSALSLSSQPLLNGEKKAKGLRGNHYNYKFDVQTEPFPAYFLD